MKKVSILLSFLAFAAVLYSCKKNDTLKSESGGSVYLDLPNTPYEYYPQANEMNQKATLGRVLFYEKRLSINNALACAGCHQQQFAFSDNVQFSRGFESRLTKRNSMPIQNLSAFGAIPLKTSGVSGGGLFFWDGRENSLESLVSRPISNHVEMGIEDVNVIPGKLSGLSYYKDLFKKAYGTEEITMQKVAECMAMFMASIQANQSRFDQAQQGLTQLTALELKGQTLFNTKYECNGCHNLFVGGYTGTEAMNIGLDYPNVDKGMGVVFNNPQWNGRFKIPNLRNVAVTAPYMHDGRFKALNDVLEHYSHNIQDDPNLDEKLRAADGRPLRMNIASDERQAIIAFLNTLTDYNMLTDPKFSNPFKVN